MNLNFELVLYKEGSEGSIYLLRFETLQGDNEDKRESEFEKFLMNVPVEYQLRAAKVKEQIESMADRHGFEEHFFEMKEGKIDDNIVVIKSDELRLYCLRYSNILLILGNGGIKPNGVRTYQDVPHLAKSVAELQKVARIIDIAIRDKEIKFLGNTFTGDLKFNIEDYE